MAGPFTPEFEAGFRVMVDRALAGAMNDELTAEMKIITMAAELHIVAGICTFFDEPFSDSHALARRECHDRLDVRFVGADPMEKVAGIVSLVVYVWNSPTDFAQKVLQFVDIMKYLANVLRIPMIDFDGADELNTARMQAATYICKGTGKGGITSAQVSNAMVGKGMVGKGMGKGANNAGG